MAYAVDVTFSFYQFLPILESLPSKFLEGIILYIYKN